MTVKPETTSQVDQYEDQLLEIVRKLPDERIQQLVDFARFLEFQMRGAYNESLIEAAEGAEDARADEEWDALLARADAKRLLRDMANEAHENYVTGRTTGITVNDEGQLEPE